MICRFCGNKLYCQDSRQSDKYTRIREYGCADCNKVFNSIEQLDPEPLNKDMQKSFVEYVKARKENA